MLLFPLQSIVPDAKPLSADQVRLGSPPQKTAKLMASDSEVVSGPTGAAAEAEAKPAAPRRFAVEVDADDPAPAPAAPPTPLVAAPAPKPEAVLAAAAPLLEATSPARHATNCVVHITNLVRPFTINQLKELLARTGSLVDGRFWIDKVKSSCLVQVPKLDHPFM